MNTITIYGPGCGRCTKLAELTREIILEQHWDATLVKETDALSMANAGVLTTPALAVNGTLLFSGKVPAKEDLLTILLPVLGTSVSRPSCTCSIRTKSPEVEAGKPDTDEKSPCFCGRTCPCGSENKARPKWKKILVWIVLAFLALAAIKLANRHAAVPKSEAEPASTGSTTSDATEADGTLGTPAIPAAFAASRLQAVYYEFGPRCPTCLRMEEWTREALEQNFAAELARGLLSFTTLPADESSARHYQLTTKAVILKTQHSGQETDWVKLERIWELSRNETAFKTYITQSVRAQLERIVP